MEGDIITMQEIFVFEKLGVSQEGKVHRPLPRHRRPAEGGRAAARGRHPAAGVDVRRRRGGAVMLLAILVFFVGLGRGRRRLLALDAAARHMAGRQLEQRLQGPLELREPDAAATRASCSTQAPSSALPGVDRFVGGTDAGSWLAKLIEQSGVAIEPGIGDRDEPRRRRGAGPVDAPVLAPLAGGSRGRRSSAWRCRSLWLKIKRSRRMRQLRGAVPRRRSICCRAPFAPATPSSPRWAWWPTSCRRRSASSSRRASSSRTSACR